MSMLTPNEVATVRLALEYASRGDLADKLGYTPDLAVWQIALRILSRHNDDRSRQARVILRRTMPRSPNDDS